MTPAFAQKSVISGGFDVGPGGFPGNFNPMAASAGFTWLSIYFEPLVVYDAKLEKLAPALATSWQVSPDKLTYTFKLAPDAKWHDGKPFTSADVKFTIGLAKDAKAGSVFAARLAAVKEVETPDAQTAVIKLSQGNAGLMDTLTKLMMLPAPSCRPFRSTRSPSMNGGRSRPSAPARSSSSSTRPTSMSRSPPIADYRGGKPKVDGLINRYFKTTATAAAALKSGEIQVSYVESDDAKTFANNPRSGRRGRQLRRQLSRLQRRRAAVEGRARPQGGHVRHRPQRHHREPLRRRGEACELRLCGRQPRARWNRAVRLQPGQGQGAAQGSRLGPDQRDQADHAAQLLHGAAGGERDGGDAGHAVAGRHQRRAEGRRRRDL